MKTKEETKQVSQKAIEYSLKAVKKDFESKKILTSLEAADFARNFYHEDILIYESVFIILLNRALRAIGYAKISQGGICGSIVDIKIIAKYAIDCLACAVILVHNHPSGNLLPSMEDERMTRTVKEGLNTLGIVLRDHIIISDSAVYSFFDEGKC